MSNASEYKELLCFATQLAKEVGAFLKNFRDEGKIKVEEKGSDLDFVTNADKTSQKMIFDAIRKRFPSHRFIGEEDGLENEQITSMLNENPDDYFWIIDPLDGTLNYIRGLGGYSVSIGITRGPEPVVGAIFSPVENELFTAAKGLGAFMNGEVIHASNCVKMHNALIIPAVPTTDLAMRKRMLAINERLAMMTLNSRMFGSAAREIAHIAQGGVEAYFELGIHPWDVTAAIVLSEEAGAIVSALDGSKYEIGNPGILVTVKGIHDAMVEAIDFR